MDIYYNFDLRIHLIKYCHLKSWNFSATQTPYWRFYWNPVPGGIIFHPDAQHMEMTSEYYFLIPPDFSLSSCNVQNFSHLFIYFSVGKPFDSIKPAIYRFDMDPLKLPVMEKLCAELENGENSLSVNLLTLSLIYNLLGNFAETDFSGDTVRDRRIEVVLNIINESLSNTSLPPTNRELAAKVHMSVSNFMACFKRHTGMSPQQYLRHKRIEEAALMLHFSGTSIDDIAAKTSFIDRYHFSKVFKSLTGRSPAEFRKNRPF